MTENVLEYSVEQTLNAQVTRREKKLQLMDLASRNQRTRTLNLTNFQPSLI